MLNVLLDNFLLCLFAIINYLVQLSCTVDANPPRVVTWLYNPNIMDSINQPELLQDSHQVFGKFHYLKLLECLKSKLLKKLFELLKTCRVVDQLAVKV